MYVDRKKKNFKNMKASNLTDYTCTEDEQISYDLALSQIEQQRGKWFHLSLSSIEFASGSESRCFALSAFHKWYPCTVARGVVMVHIQPNVLRTPPLGHSSYCLYQTWRTHKFGVDPSSYYGHHSIYATLSFHGIK
jgi:hypothetical protein